MFGGLFFGGAAARLDAVGVFGSAAALSSSALLLAWKNALNLRYAH